MAEHPTPGKDAKAIHVVQVRKRWRDEHRAGDRHGLGESDGRVGTPSAPRRRVAIDRDCRQALQTSRKRRVNGASTFWLTCGGLAFATERTMPIHNYS